MAEIITSKGHAILVDDEDLVMLSAYTWYVNDDGYAATNVPHPLNPETKTILLMHRLIIGVGFGDGKIIDHENRNRIDNRRKNIRFCTSYENMQNRGKQINNTSGYKGVSLNKRLGSWEASIGHEGADIYLGVFRKAEEAAHAYNKAAISLFGDFAVLNPVEGIFIDDDPPKIRKRSANAKLSDADVTLIRNSMKSGRELGRQFGVDHRTIDRVRSGIHYATTTHED